MEEGGAGAATEEDAVSSSSWFRFFFWSLASLRCCFFHALACWRYLALPTAAIFSYSSLSLGSIARHLAATVLAKSLKLILPWERLGCWPSRLGSVFNKISRWSRKTEGVGDR